METAAKLTIDLEGETHNIECQPGETILEAALRENLDAPYSCLSGSCTSCQAQVVSGSAEMDVCDVLDDDEIKAGEILTCQARPTSPDLLVRFP